MRFSAGSLPERPKRYGRPAPPVPPLITPLCSMLLLPFSAAASLMTCASPWLCNVLAVSSAAKASVTALHKGVFKWCLVSWSDNPPPSTARCAPNRCDTCLGLEEPPRSDQSTRYSG